MKVLTILLCLFVSPCFSQKQYNFDHIIEYELNQNKDSLKVDNHHFRNVDEKKRLVLLTNSTNNDYYAVVTEKDSFNYRMVFHDYNFGFFVDVNFLKTDLNKAEFININCDYVRKFSIADKLKTKNHDFIVLKDTIINEKSYARYKLIELESIKKRVGSEVFIVDKSTENHLPILNWTGAYIAGKDNKKLPNGILFQKYFIDHHGKISAHEKFVRSYKTTKKIIIKGNCLDTGKKEKFIAGAKITENKIPKEIKNSKSILFVFKNGGCGPYFYLDLEKYIKREFKKSDTKVDFIFASHYLEHGVKVPTTIDASNKYELICEINEENFNGWDNDLNKKRKQNYDLVLTFKKSNSNSISGLAKINVNSYWTITTQNKNTSKLIYELFND